MLYLYSLTFILLIVSSLCNWKKTIVALKIAYKRFKSILSAFMMMLILISIVLYWIPDELIVQYMGKDNQFVSVVCGLFFGSISLMPGFIVYPLCGILLEKGVSYIVLAAFSTTLMMVGILTFPLEKEFLGFKIALIRNFLYLLISVIVTIIVGFWFGELIFF